MSDEGLLQPIRSKNQKWLFETISSMVSFLVLEKPNNSIQEPFRLLSHLPQTAPLHTACFSVGMRKTPNNHSIALVSSFSTSHLVGFQPDKPREEGKAMEAGRCAEHHAVGTTSTLSRGVEALWLDGSRRGSAAVVQQPRGTRGARLACRATGDVCLFVGSDWWRHRRKRKQSGVLGVMSQGNSGRSFFHLLSSLLHSSSLHLYL